MSLHRLHVSIRFLILLILVAAPCGALGALLGGLQGSIVGFILGDLLLLMVAFRAEAILLRAFKAKPLLDPGPVTSLRAALRDLERENGGFETWETPGFYIYPDPAPNAATLRELGSPGSILVSRGLMSQLNEEELRLSLRSSILRLDDREWSFSTLCAALGVLLSYVTPSEWSTLFFSAETVARPKKHSNIRLVRFLCLYPWIRLLQALSCKVPASRTLQETWLSAMRKIQAGTPASGRIQVPAAMKLYLVDPTPSEQLIHF